MIFGANSRAQKGDDMQPTQPGQNGQARASWGARPNDGAQSQNPASEAALTRELSELGRLREQLGLDHAKAINEQERASSEWDAARAELVQEFGTDDLDEIERMISEREARNLASVSAYRSDLTDARAQVQDALQRQQAARAL
jgi:hypothetical protein